MDAGEPSAVPSAARRLTLDLALRLLHAAAGDARSRGFRPMGIVVVDAAGQTLASAREDGAGMLRLDIARGKACAAIGMGTSTRTLAQRAKDLPVFYASVASVASQPFVPQTGALLIRDTSGALLGAIGASGGTGDEDEQICTTAVTACGLSAAETPALPR